MSFGLHRKGAHDRGALLLAAGEAIRVLVLLLEEPESLEKPAASASAWSAGHAQDLTRRRA